MTGERLWPISAIARFARRFGARGASQSQETVATFETVQARRMIVQAADGSPRVELGTSNGGDALVRLRDRAGVVRAVLSVQDDMPRVRLLDDSGTTRLTAILREGVPGVELLDARGEPRLIMYLRGHEHEAPDLYFVDERGSPRFGVALDSSGQVTLSAQDEAGSLSEPLWFRKDSGEEDEPLD